MFGNMDCPSYICPRKLTIKTVKIGKNNPPSRGELRPHIPGYSTNKNAPLFRFDTGVERRLNC